MTFPNEGKSGRRLYRRTFLQACAMTVICFVVYTFVRSNGTARLVIYGATRWKLNIDSMSNINKLAEESISEVKQVLVWTPYFSESKWLPSTNELNCSVPNCSLTYDKELIHNSSAVILHWRNIDPDQLPDCLLEDGSGGSNPCPPLVLFNKEAPPHVPERRIARIDDKITWTVSYRRDSDIFAPYGWIANRTTNYEIPNLQSKTSEVCWLVSHCSTQSNREEYVQQLGKYIEIEIYGRCGNRTCPHESSLECYRWLSKRCKFYLSFENSFCKDYVTEKLFYALMTDMVPVVMGGEDYSGHLPPRSVINVRDYSSPEDLARYLREVGRNESLYLSYFEWNRMMEAVFVPYSWFCVLCDLLHRTDRTKVKPTRSISSWWFEGAKCGSL